MRCAVKYQLLLCVACLMPGLTAGAQDHASARPAGSAAPVRVLRGDEYAEAARARNHADLLRAALEREMSEARIRAADAQRDESVTEDYGQQADEVIRAYQQVIARYPHTEIAAGCAVRLAGFYQQLRRFDEAAQLLATSALEYQGTYQGTRISFNAGLIHAQARDDQLEAMQWFARIPKPSDPSDPNYQDALKLHLSAQEQLAKCELKLGQVQQAERRITDLKRIHPEHSDEVDRFHQFQTTAAATTPAHQSPASRRSTVSVLMIGNVAFVLTVVGLFVIRKFRNGELR